MAQLSRARDRVDALDRRHHPGRAGQGDPRARQGVVSISGGPGTGKTVVALHRAAYLLYTDRRRYETGGVLVVGPSGVFMRYIERVLPSLGETAVALRSLGEVVDGVRATRHDEPAVADVKGSARMAERDAPRRAAAGAREPDRVPDLLARRRDRARPRPARPGPAPADVPGPPQPAAAAGRPRPARRDVAPGARRARPRARARVLRRRDARQPALPRLRARLVAAARRRRRCSAGCATPSCSRGSARACSAPRSSGCCSSRGRAARRRPVGRGRAADRRAALRPRRRARAHRGRARRPARPRIEGGGRHAGADDRLRPRVRPRRPGLGPAHPPHRGRRLRPRAHRRGPGPHAHAVADGRAPRPHRVVDDRRRPGPVVLAGARPRRPPRAPRRWRARQLHEFHLSTNYRNSAEIYDYAAGYARRVGLDADLPDRRTLAPASRPWCVTGVADLEAAAARGGRRGRRARSAAPSASSCRSPAARRSTPGWPRGPSSPTTPPARAPPSTPRSPRRGRTGSWC